jgi:hypothetical protein
LCLEELTRASLDEPLEPAQKHRFRDAAPNVPDWLRLVIAERLDRGPDLKPFIQTASVLGREFSVRLLAELLPTQRAELPDAIARLVDLGLLIPQHDADVDRVRFKHALIHEAVHETLIRSDRQRLHSRAAESLVQHFDGRPESSPDVLAHHLVEAGRFGDAVRALTRASGQTAHRAAYVECVGHCRAALALLPQVGADVRQQLELELLQHLGVALSATRGYAAPEVRQTYEQARSLCAEGTEPQVVFPIVRGLGTFYFVSGQMGDAAEIASRCEALATESGRSDYLIEALSFRGYTSVYRGELADGRAALRRCVEVYRAQAGHELAYPSPQDAGTAAWSLLPIAEWLVGGSSDAEAAVREALAHSERLGRPFDTAYVHVWVAMLRNMQQQFAAAEEHARICIEISERHGFNTWLLAARMHACIARAGQEASPISVATLRRVLDAFAEAGAEANAPFFLWGVAQGLRVMGDTASASEAVADGLRRAESTGESYFVPELLLLSAQLDSDEDRAVAALRRGFEIARQQGAVPFGLRIGSELARRNAPVSGDHPAWGGMLATGGPPLADRSDAGEPS